MNLPDRLALPRRGRRMTRPAARRLRHRRLRRMSRSGNPSRENPDFRPATHSRSCSPETRLTDRPGRRAGYQPLNCWRSPARGCRQKTGPATMSSQPGTRLKRAESWMNCPTTSCSEKANCSTSCWTKTDCWMENCWTNCCWTSCWAMESCSTSCWKNCSMRNCWKTNCWTTSCWTTNCSANSMTKVCSACSANSRQTAKTGRR